MLVCGILFANRCLCDEKLTDAGTPRCDHFWGA
jgi:hypothetical protein